MLNLGDDHGHNLYIATRDFGGVVPIVSFSLPSTRGELRWTGSGEGEPGNEEREEKSDNGSS